MKRLLSSALLLSVLAPTATGAWKYTENIDPMTDEDTSFASTMKGSRDFIAVRCSGSNSYEILVGVGEYIGSSDRYQVDYRVDKTKAQDAGRWGTDTQGVVVFAPDNWKDKLLEELQAFNEIVFQVTDFQGTQPYSKFSLSGSSAAINQLNCI